MFKKLFIHQSHHIGIQFIRYGFVAVAAQVVDFGLLFVFAHYMGVPDLLAATLSFLISLVANYFLSRLWVFSNQSAHKRAVEVTIFFIVAAVGLGLTLLIMWALTSGGLNYLKAKAVAIVIVFFWSFLGRRYIVFNGLKALGKAQDGDQPA